MEAFAKSWFWRFWAASLVVAVVYAAWTFSGGAALSTVEAGGVFGQGRPGTVYTTSEDGSVLYSWPILGQAASGHLERWNFADGSVTYKAVTYYTPGAPGVQPGAPGTAPVPLPPGYYREPLPPAPEPGSGR
ncbi:MAG: hypothetical protein ACYS22_11190 [Planctomycetota bacterium]|jgi:hypothetical protein